MKKKQHASFIIAILSTSIAFVLACSNIYFYISYTSLHSQIYTAASSGAGQGNFPFPNPNSDVENAPTVPHKNTEEGIVSTSEQFLLAFYNADTAQDNKEYLKGFDGIITENGYSNMRNYLNKNGEKDSTVRIQTQLVKNKVYMRTQGSADATAFCISYVQQTLTISENTPIITNDPYLLQLELKLESDNVWRVNSISFERAIGMLPMDLNALLG